MWNRRTRPGVLLAIAGLSLYLLLPSMLAVFATWRSLSHLNWYWAALVLVCESASYGCLWALDRIALHTRAWFAVAAAQLSGNAVGRILPGGGATATAFSVSMLRGGGIDTGEAVTAFGASTALQLATTLALPVLALPAIVGGAPVDHSLATAAYLGIAVLVLLLAAGAAAFTADAPLELAGRGIQLVKAANTLSAEVLGSDPNEAGGQRVIFISGDDADAKAAVVALFQDAGFAAIDLGDLATGGAMQQIHHPLAGVNLIRL